MSELVPYISRATPFAPVKEHVQQRYSPDEGLRDIANKLNQSTKLIEETVRRQSAFKADSEFLQTTAAAEKVFNEKLQGLQGGNEEEVKKNLESILSNDIKPLYGKMHEKLDYPEVRRHILQQSNKQMARFQLKANEYKLGFQVQRTEEGIREIERSVSNSLLLDGSDSNYREKVQFASDAIDKLPLNPTTKDARRRTTRENAALAQAQRYMVDNPQVFSSFIQKREGQGSKIDDKSTIADIVDNTPLDTFSVNDTVVDNTNPFEGWKDLSTQKKIAILKEVANASTTGKQEERSRVGTKIKNIASFLERGITPKNIQDADLSEDNLRHLFGNTRGQMLSSQLQTLKEFAPKINQIFLMPNDQVETELTKLKPDVQNLVGAEFKNKLYSDGVKAVYKNDKERKEHPIKWAITHGLTQEMPDEPSKWGDFFVHRREVSQTLKGFYGVSSPLISKEESRKLTQYLDKLESKDVVSHLEDYAERLGGLKNSVWIEAMQSLEHPVMGEVGLLLKDDPDVASDVLRGYKYRVRNRGENIRDITGERFDAWFKERFREKYGNVFASIGDYGDAEFDRASKLVGYHLAGELLSDKTYSFHEAPTQSLKEWVLRQPASQYDKNLQHSFEAVVGNIPVPMGDFKSPLIPPRGMSSEDFTNKFTAVAQQVFEESGLSGKEYGYENIGPTSDGSAQYLVKFGREYIHNPKTGAPLVIEVSPYSIEHEQTIQKTLKDSTAVTEEKKNKTVKRILENPKEGQHVTEK
ncbi:hypothetical protein BWK56_05755 [Candidatus Liberibacter asiaticus]|nr:hypothetical protein [Candidatus Liberibacter asiaticus]OMH86463.1 hypothetical protein BWK56_05755 [Candidatus Liberibacter asiaticus]